VVHGHYGGPIGKRERSSTGSSVFSYANVVSTLCLFLLLGGGAYAANRLAKNSVGSRELKPRAVGPAHLKNRAVTFRTLHPNARRRLRGARGPEGIPGAPGQQGPPGDPAAIGLGVVGTANLAPAIPAVRVTHSLSVGIEGGSLSKPLSFDEERYDTADMHDPAANSRLTAPVAGVYLITGNIEWSSEGEVETTGTRTVVIVRNDKTVIAQERVDASDFDGTHESPSPQNTVQALATQAFLAQGDHVDVRVGHTQMAELVVSTFSTIESLESSPEFAMTWLAPGPAN